MTRPVTTARLAEPLPSIKLPDHEILEGTPDARCLFTAESADRGACAGFWSCDVGKYEFLFDYDEFVYLIRGRVVVTDGDKQYVLEAGDTAHFPQGITVVWEITERMTKYFVARAPY